MTIADRVAADLRWVASYWPDLVETRVPGTPRPWRQPDLDLDLETKAECDRQARLERHERNGLAPGESPAPVHVDILDTMAELLADADAIHDQVARSAKAGRLDPPSSAYADARPYLEHAARHIRAAHKADPGVTEWAHDRARDLVDRTARALALVYDGQRLDVVCPWCCGVTAEAPAGGARTWRVRELPGKLVAIVCYGMCEPPEREAGTWWRGHPAWPVHEWDWLAGRVRHARR